MGRALLHVFFDRLSTTGGQHTSGLEPKEKKKSFTFIFAKIYSKLQKYLEYSKTL